MNINKTENNPNNKFRRTEHSSKGERTSNLSPQKISSDQPTDKVSIRDYPFHNDERLFAKLQLDKLNNSSSKQLGKLKAKVNEYQEALNSSSLDADKTELGKKINDPDVWGDIANKILRQ